MDLKRRRRRRWAYPFFGLTNEYKVQLHELIYDLCHYGKIEYFAVYEMPVHYRNFYIRKLISTKEQEKKDYDKAHSKSDVASSKIVRGPSVRP